MNTSIEDVWREYSASLNAGDLNRWMSLWTEGGIQMPPGEPPLVGKNEIRARNEAVLDQFEFDISIANHEVETVGDWAYSRGVYQATLTPKRGGQSIDVDGKYMTILKKQPDGSWKIHRDVFNSNVGAGN